MKLSIIVLHLVFLAALVGARPAWCAPQLDLDIRLDPAKRSLTATAAITTDATVLSFYLADHFVVQSVELDGATIPTNRTVLEGLQRFQIDFPDAQLIRTVTVRYHGELHLLDTSLTHDDTLKALPAMASSEGAYLPGNSSWHPIFETAFTFRLNITVPAGQIAVAPGTPSNESSQGGVRKASFAMKWPVDQIDIMVGPWSIRERELKLGDSLVRIRTYFGETEASLADGYLDAAERFIKRYSNEIGPYPYTVFSVVSSPIPTGFGMPTLTYLGRQVLAYPFIRDISLGHEILHSWWGTDVRVDPVRGNWAEGLTTFMADYAYREDESAIAAMRMRHGWLRDYAALPPDNEKPLSSFRARYHTASATIGYGKSAMMFYSLRNRLGKEAFTKGIRLFWTKYQHAPASFDNLREAFEQASGQSLVVFFNQWLDRTGAPRLAIARARMSTGGKTEVQLEMSQDAKPYDLSVPLRLLVKDKTIDTRVHLTASTLAVNIPVPAAASAVQIDPQFEVWRKLYPEEAPPILRDLVAAESVQMMAVGKRIGDDATALANAFSEGDILVVNPPDKPDASRPLIIVGSKTAVTAYLKEQSLPGRPAEIAPGVVEVWVFQDITRKVAVIAMETGAKKNHDLSKLGQRLRHFGGSSWVSIAADGETVRGNWPIESPRFKISK